MRILIFSWRDPKHPFAGGAEQVMHEHAKGWIEKGHKVTLFSSKFPGAKERETIEGVEIFRKGTQYLGVQLEGFKYYISRSKKYNLVVDQFHGIPFFTPLYVKKPLLAVVQETAKNVWFLNHLPFPTNFGVGLIGYLLEPIIFKLYRRTHFMTGSLSAKKEIQKFGIHSANITVIQHGLSQGFSKKVSQKEKNPTVIFLGRLSKDKGIKRAIGAFEILFKKDSNFKFWIVGKPETKNFGLDLLKKINKSALKNSIKMWGFVTQKKKFELLARAHVLINPSFREGWGLVNIEANSVGTPVVAYDSPGLVDSIKTNYSGIICKQNTIEELAKNIYDLIYNKSRYNKLSKNAIRWSRNFSWDKSIDKSTALLKSIAKDEHK